jgi:hypothetical protein
MSTTFENAATSVGSTPRSSEPWPARLSNGRLCRCVRVGPRHHLAGLNDVSGLGAIRVGNRSQVRCGNRYSVSPGK